MKISLPVLAFGLLLATGAAMLAFQALAPTEPTAPTECAQPLRLRLGTPDGADSLGDASPFYTPGSEVTVRVLTQPCPTDVDSYRWYFGGPGGLKTQVTTTTTPSQTFHLEHVASHTVTVDLLADDGSVLWNGIEHAWIQPQVRFEATATLNAIDSDFSWEDSVACCPSYLRIQVVQVAGPSGLVPFDVRLLDEDGSTVFQHSSDLEATHSMFHEALGSQWVRRLRAEAEPLTAIPVGAEYEVRFEVETFAYDVGLGA